MLSAQTIAPIRKENLPPGKEPRPPKGCYGFGDIMGTPSAWLRSDLERVQDFQVANDSDIYLAGINFYFEGSSLIQSVYRSRSDPKLEKMGWAHGVDNETEFFKFRSGYFNLSNDTSTLSVPTSFFDKSSNMVAFQVQELQYNYWNSSTPQRFDTVDWVLEGFKLNQSKLIEKSTVDRQILGANQLFRESSTCALNVRRSDTRIVGFASTTAGPDATRIKSLQAIYYSTNANICGCIKQQPTIK